MKIFENVDISGRINNFYFKKFGLDYRDILNNSGLVVTKNSKGKEFLKPWFEVYMFDKEEDYLEYKDHVLKELRKLVSDKEVEEEFNYFDLFHGPVQKYLLEKERIKEVRVVEEDAASY